MNKIINGKRYDTESAKRMGVVESGHLPNDFNFWRESLFRTKTGNFFIHGEGGGNSRYGEWRGNSGGPGEKIIPISEEDARIWAEKNLTADEYESIFELAEEGTVKISADISQAAKKRLDEMRMQSGKSVGEILSDLILSRGAGGKKPVSGHAGVAWHGKKKNGL